MGNPGIDLDLSWVESVQVNRSAVDRRAAQIGARRSIKKKEQLAWLVRSVRCIDLTTLAGDDTPCNVRRLCSKAAHPLHKDVLRGLGVEDANITTGAVCVYPNRVRDAGTLLVCFPQCTPHPAVCGAHYSGS